ncbi:MAG: hypothetical protein ACI9VR_003901 [Cognaticolwellia sp.]|jgi:hypothetical protein
MRPWSAAVDARFGPLAAWLAAHDPASHQALADLDPRVFPPDARRGKLWRRAEQDLNTLRQQVWLRTQKSGLQACSSLEVPTEIQRSGLLGHPVLHGRLFPALLFKGLLVQEQPFKSEARPNAPLPEQSHDRYYAELPEMPGDVDSAAAIALAEEPIHLLKGALERLRWALAQNPMPVWQGEGWFGPHCPAVSGRALSAAAAHGIPVNPALIADLSALSPWVKGIHYPDPVVASVLVAQGLRDQGQPHRALERMMASAPVSNWSVLGTAKVASFAGDRLSPRRREKLLVRLVQTQRWDGSWPATPWYLVPALHGGMTVFGSSAYNTAAALRALAELRPGPHPEAPPAAAQ